MLTQTQKRKVDFDEDEDNSQDSPNTFLHNTSKHYYCRFGLMGKLSLARFIKTIFLLFLSDVVDEFTANKTLSLFYLAEPALEVCKYLEINVYNNVFDAIIIWIQIDR